MSRKPQKTSKRFGTLLGEYLDGSAKVKVYQDGNQIYFVKAGKILPDMTMHVDDLEELLTMLETIEDLEEETDES